MFLLSLLFLSMAQAEPARSQALALSPTEACRAELGTGFEFPRGWGIKAGELEPIMEFMPEFEPALTIDLRLAQFISGESEQFFNMLGFLANAGLDEDSFRLLVGNTSTLITPKAHRLQVVRELLDAAVAGNFFPASLNTERVSMRLANILGPLPFAKPLDVNQEFLGRFASPADYAKIRQQSKMKMVDFVRHSSKAQIVLLALCFKKYDPTLVQAQKSLRLRLAGTPGPEAAEIEELLDHATQLLDGRSFPELANRPFECRREQHQFEKTFFDRAFAGYFKALSDTARLAAANDKSGFVARNPLAILTRVMDAVERDTWENQRLNNYVLRFVIEKVFRLQMVPGPDIAARVKEDIRQHYAHVRTLWRESTGARSLPQAEIITTAPSPVVSVAGPPVPALNEAKGLSRQERKRLYAERQQATADAEKTTSTDAPFTIAADTATETSTAVSAEESFWDALGDSRLTLKEIRALVRLRLEPDVTYVLPVRRNGFRYNVSFSAKLLEHILNPRGTEPADPRTWIKALRLGADIVNGPSSWHKRASGMWEFRLGTPRYLMVGTKTGHSHRWTGIERYK